LKRTLKRIGIGIGIFVVVALAAGGGYVAQQAHAFNASMAKVYDVPYPDIVRTIDPVVATRGRHIAESIGGCATRDCHGADLSGGQPIVMGPLGTITAPNITPGSPRMTYSDQELARLIIHGVKRDGRSVLFMPAQELNWLPDDDIKAVISYLRVVMPSPKLDGKTEVGLLGEVLDRRGAVILDVARRIDHEHRATAPTPSPTAAYGAFVARLCVGCHGEHLGGGPIPGAPPSIPIPKNITAHETGIKGWTYSDFLRLLEQGVKKDGQKLNPFMPFEALGKMNDVEKHALWAYLEAVPPVPFGSR
jgi:mono/diheme cytochrome c family protein